MWECKPNEGATVVLRHDKPVEKGVFSPDGLRVATGDRSTVRTWDAGSGRQVGAIVLNNFDLLSFQDGAFCETGEKMVVIFGSTVAIGDTASGRWSSRWEIPGREAFRGPDHADGELLVASHKDGASVWEADTGKQVARLAGSSGEGGLRLGRRPFTRDGRKVVGVLDETVRTWDARTGRELGRAVFGSRPADGSSCPPSARADTDSSPL